MRGLGVNLYPWDVAGDPDCADRIADLGADRVTLAAAYHTVRALSPRHPTRKVVTATHSAVYYHPDSAHWEDSLLRPAEAAWAPGSFTAGAKALQSAGLKVYAWTILAHNQRLGTMHHEHAVVNAFGDPYAWALCINSPEVRTYSALLASEVAGQPHIDGIELESCGWYGYDHLHAHDKTGGMAFDSATKFLLNLCFCAACTASYADAGLDGLRDVVRAALAPVFLGVAETATLPADLLEAVSILRVKLASTYQAEVIAAVRATRADLPILLHTSPDALAAGANPGAVPDGTFGAVLQCGGVRSDAALVALHAYADALAKAGTPQPLAATLNIVGGMGCDSAGIVDWAEQVRAAGADELRLYHAGIASASDLTAIKALSQL
ncbi:hypothetical protein KDK95_19805 [Actinospica sp. MGRD01-02]|uniref:Alanine-rich protein n=1 Tax=Actinospica acidithermotolerans TaxID=2828514 RepID=A0A941IMH3_9ACTN|nr:hypothetical protein [Actinospica acidithermotolerans]MBR7828566.1 hypothetical protein [Actinospica acidithermotolerans]